MSLDLLLAGATGGVVGAMTVLAAQTVSAAVTNLTKRTRATKSSRPTRPTIDHPEPSLFTPHVRPHVEWHSAGSTTPEATATEPGATAAHARLRERQLAEFADQLAGDDPVLRERLRRFEGGLR